MVDSEYEKLSPIAQRSVHILTSLGEAFPKCATLETMTRSVIRANEFQPEKIGKILDRFQGRARKAGNPVLLQKLASDTARLLLPSRLLYTIEKSGSRLL